MEGGLNLMEVYFEYQNLYQHLYFLYLKVTLDKKKHQEHRHLDLYDLLLVLVPY